MPRTHPSISIKKPPPPLRLRIAVAKLLQNCHSEEWSDEESHGSSVKILPFTQNDIVKETFEAKPSINLLPPCGGGLRWGVASVPTSN